MNMRLSRVALLALAARSASQDSTLPAGFWTQDNAGSALPRKPNGLPVDYTYSYSEAPLPPPPEPPPPPPPLPPPPPASITLCSNSCPKAPKFASDSFCDDGGPDATFDNCDLGTDCSDCGPRVRLARVPSAPRPPPSPKPPPPRKVVPAIAGGGNPFQRSDARGFYVSLERRLQLVRALNGTSASVDAGAIRTGLLASWDAPVGFWIEGKASIRGLVPSGSALLGVAGTAEAVLQDAAAQPSPQPLVVLVLHALPNRDCHRTAPASEICCHFAMAGGEGILGTTASGPPAMCDYSATSDSTCEVGLSEYKVDVVDELASLLEYYEERVPIALVLEPGSLDSLALGGSAPKCAGEATRHAYSAGVAYAIETLSNRAPGVTLYLAAGDGGTLGWGERVRTFVTQVSRLGELAHRLRGYATNVGGYQPLGEACPAEHAGSLPTYCRLHADEPCCASDPCGLLERFNSGVGELNYVQLLSRHLRVAMPGLKPHFLVDTGRNGVERSRLDCDSACNLRGAGLGLLPTAQTALQQVDAYYWLLPPGVSDGCGTLAQRCVRAEPACARDDALGARPREEAPPEAGELFLPLLRRLAAQAAAKDADVVLSEDHHDGALRGSQELTRAAQEAFALAARAGVPVAWASGLSIDAEVSPADSGNGRRGGSALLLLAAAAAAASVVTIVLLRRRGTGRGRVSPKPISGAEASLPSLDLDEEEDEEHDEDLGNLGAPEAVGLLTHADGEADTQAPGEARDRDRQEQKSESAESAPAVRFRCVD